MDAAATVTYDVAIVGYGPTGATLATALGRRGVSVLVLDRETAILDLPRAVHFDGEVMRIFQSLGLAAAIEPIVRPSGGMRYLSPGGRLLIERKAADAVGPHGWRENYLFHQPDLEGALRAAAARHASLTFAPGWNVEAIDQDTTLARVRARRGSEVREYTARYVIGCDGARSLVREAIGAGHEDLGLHQPWLVVDLTLHAPLATLPETTVQYCDVRRPTTFVKVVGLRRRWELMLMPGDDPQTIGQPDNVWRMLAPWLTPDQARLDRGAVYTFHSLIATRWRDRRLLIAGDAAHQTPPFLGQGMCAGIRDAANLAWKLADVVQGRAPDTLLDTYQSERAAHVRHFIELAVRLGNILQTTDPRVAAERDAGFAREGTMPLANLSPALGRGLRDAAAPAGEILPQFALDDGRLLDDAIGDRFATVAKPSATARLSSAAREHLARLDSAVIDAPSAARDAWLARNGAQAAIVRPDRYLFTLSRDGAALEHDLARLAAHYIARDRRAAYAGGDR